MKNRIGSLTVFVLTSFLMGCSPLIVDLSSDKLKIINRSAISNSIQNLSLNGQEGVGLAILKDVKFEKGTIELELRGENKPGRSFVGFAFNIQNDSTYEAIYFRPFNFEAKEKVRREHSIQYVSQPKNDWRYLRTNFEGRYEAEFPNPPSPDDWFRVRIKVVGEMVYVFDMDSNTELLGFKRLERQSSHKVALWTGQNSKGDFRNLRLLK